MKHLYYYIGFTTFWTIIVFTCFVLFIVIAAGIVSNGKPFFWQIEYFNPDYKRPKNIILKVISWIVKG